MAIRTPVSSFTKLGLRQLRRCLPRPTRPTILMYHRIAVESFDPWGLAVSPDNFAAQVGWLERHRTILPLTGFAVMHREGRLPANSVVITFDDGYACNAAVAAPLLQRLRIPATIFLPLASIEQGREFWWDELERIVLEHPGPALRLDEAPVLLGLREPSDRDWPPGDPPRTARQRSFHQIWKKLRTKSPAGLESSMLDLRSQTPASSQPRSSHRPLSVEEARNLTQSTIEIGSHTLTHPSLPTLASADKALEILGSVERCLAVAGVRPRTFAYPYGDHDPEAERLVERAGFLCACTTERSPVKRSSRPFALPRLQVGDWSAPRLAQIIAGV